MPQFDTHEYIRNLGQELVFAYNSAGQATTPGLKGNAREKSVRDKFESILPGGVGVGTGCVIDSEGNASAQMDMVLYEQQFCPVFKVANDVCHYPCESVIAVGSIKSAIGKKELKSIYENIASVRQLKKFTRPTQKDRVPVGKIEWRSYLAKDTQFTDGDWETIQDSSSATQIYAFGLGQSFDAKPETMLEHTEELYEQVPDKLRPNVVLTLKQGMIAPAEGGQMSYSALGCSEIDFLEPESSLEYLLVSLFRIIHAGKTSPGHVFERYVVPPPMNRPYRLMSQN